MIKHTIEISQRPARISLKNRQLVLKFDNDAPDGEVRVTQFTDKQFSRMEVYRGKRRVDVEEEPAQLEMF